MKRRIFALTCAAGFAGMALALPAAVPADQAAGEGEPGAVQPPEDVVSMGAAVFAQRCAACHSAEPGKPSHGGPNLAGVVGRQAGSAQYRYSPAMRDSGLIWTEQELDAFLEAPSRKLPGTYMAVPLRDAALRQAVIAYLATTKGE
ncbi:MAG: c-type cytochrome [Novosphingobium sp.]|nr:c-type cytochrome [Novosphingobium sp.]